VPELTFRVRWPDGSEQRCFSPSSTTRTFFTTGEAYPLDEFLDRSRRALELASERVRLKYGFACSSAAAQLQQIEHAATRFASMPDARVTVQSFEDRDTE
jgi:uncharacterized repeat protein (TIGR04042 family)